MLATLALAAALVVGPPWISIEYPANPHDRSNTGTMLYVHVFHHAQPIAYPLVGTAEGFVNGERRSIKLKFTETARPAVYGLSRQWPTEGVWTLVIKMSRGQNGEDGATAVVELGPDGEIASVRVPTRQQGQWTIPVDVSMTEIDRALRNRSSALAVRR
ncbi:MAG TPA: hypothetical protein VFO67_14290 [Gemmatimonadales bacterium]|nr:hypothetical protein [Gemmatimonadales bacterium]